MAAKKKPPKYLRAVLEQRDRAAKGEPGFEVEAFPSPTKAHSRRRSAGGKVFRILGKSEVLWFGPGWSTAGVMTHPVLREKGVIGFIDEGRRRRCA